MNKPLDFIDLLEPVTGRVSSLGIYGNRNADVMTVVGGLAHNSGIVPRSKEAADKMIAWLQEWKQSLP